MRTSQPLQQQLSALVGEDVFRDGVLQKAILAAYLLQSETHVQAVNAVIHPAVAHDFEQSGQSWLESAILFDSGFDKRTHIDRTFLAIIFLYIFVVDYNTEAYREKFLCLRILWHRTHTIGTYHKLHFYLAWEGTHHLVIRHIDSFNWYLNRLLCKYIWIEFHLYTGRNTLGIRKLTKVYCQLLDICKVGNLLSLRIDCLILSNTFRAA